jgi:hypothetical protein
VPITETKKHTNIFQLNTWYILYYIITIACCEPVAEQERPSITIPSEISRRDPSLVIFYRNCKKQRSCIFALLKQFFMKKVAFINDNEHIIHTFQVIKSRPNSLVKFLMVMACCHCFLSERT